MVSFQFSIAQNGNSVIIVNGLLVTHIGLSLLSYSAFLLSFITAFLFIILDRELRFKHLGRWFKEIPPLQLLDRINYFSIVIGFLCLSGGAISGFIWSGRVFGTFFRLDPKEICVLFTLFTYALLFYLRTTSTLRGRKVAIFSVLSFSLAIFTFLGVNYLLPTWHRYL